MKNAPILHDLVNRIDSRESLIVFIRLLADDFRDNSEEWENKKLDRYLDALSAWVEDMDGYFRNRGETVPENPTWELLGKIFLASKYYE